MFICWSESKESEFFSFQYLFINFKEEVGISFCEIHFFLEWGVGFPLS